MFWHEIIATAIHSPSPHNVQPWLVKILSETEAELYIDPKRTLPKEDITGSFIILTMGIFLEALSILAKPKGFSLDTNFFTRRTGTRARSLKPGSPRTVGEFPLQK
ncbi:MAG TPA: hypothetical protein VGO50_10220 [Pyrinomonadaceae bacterium]|jgi:hypothetical protein|nr:hypothetical protein [Pyrinomonadaceae bacterium]